ncbi:MAG: hypothetical protein GX621_07195, partial [Pirellulaceae bacterium]|nr:hypothetical protein [Pirellulaceae bacterium]
IYYKNHLFGVREHDKQLVCLDLEGNEVWASGRENKFGLGPYLIADDLIYVLDDSGHLTMAEATPEAYKPLGQASILEGHDAWAPMALASGRLVLRDMTRMACVDVAESLPRPGTSANATRRVGQDRVDRWWGDALVTRVPLLATGDDDLSTRTALLATLAGLERAGQAVSSPGSIMKGTFASSGTPKQVVPARPARNP